MPLWLIIICIYLALGIICTIIFTYFEPVILHVPLFIPLWIIAFPYIIYVIIRIRRDRIKGRGDGRWI